MAQRRVDFLCFLASQAKQDIKNKVEETAFKILYPMERKSKEVKQQLEETAFQLLYPLECGYHKGCEQVAKTAFHVIYPIECKSKEWKQAMEEQAFSVLYPMEQKWQKYLASEAARKAKQETFMDQVEPLVQRYKHITSQVAKQQNEQRQSLATCKQKVYQLCSKQVEKLEKQRIACSEWMQQQAKKVKRYVALKKAKKRLSLRIKQPMNTGLYAFEIPQLSYLKHHYFKLMHRKLERLYEHQCTVFHRYYSLICNRIAQYFAMLFGITTYWARASSVSISMQCE